MEITVTADQRQKMSQAQIQSLQLLALDNFELQQMMEEEYLDNPLLECADVRVTSGTEPQMFRDRNQPGPELPAREHEYQLEQLITSQLAAEKYSEKEWQIIQYVIGNLDESGFFTSDVREVAADMQTTEEIVEKLLYDLKKLEPYGIFARDLKECLLLQLDAMADKSLLKRQLIEEHLEELAQGKISKISRTLHVSTAEVRKALWEIGKLNPRPLNGADSGVTSYVVPDILMYTEEGVPGLKAELNDNWSASYHISDYYFNLMKTSQEPELAGYFEKKYLRARALITGIEQRRATIIAVAEYTGKIQHQFLCGEGNKKPVTMTEAASALGIAVSTVSRAVRGKYIQCPAGSLLFKDLFAGGIRQDRHAQVKSGDEIKEQIKQLIEQEDKNNPLSDMNLVKKLAEREIIISRRTVTKYRDSLGIKGCFDRRYI